MRDRRDEQIEAVLRVDLHKVQSCEHVQCFIHFAFPQIPTQFFRKSNPPCLSTSQAGGRSFMKNTLCK